MKKKIYKGSIALNKDGIIYIVSALYYTIYEDESFEYEFIPNYFVIDLLDSSIFQGIPGLNLDLRKTSYIRKNVTPVFISERVPQKNREDFIELLKEVNLEYYNPILYLLKTNTRYGGDSLYLVPYEEKKIVDIEKISGKNNLFGIIKIILDNLAKGNDVLYNSTLIDDLNRKDFFKILIQLYKKTLNQRKDNLILGINKAKKAKKYKGRKPKNVDMLLYNEYLSEVKSGRLTAKEAAKKIGISIDKYYRLKRNNEI